MLELIFTVCSIVAGATCKEVHLTYVEDTPPTAFSCAFKGQVEMAKWCVANPNWRIQGWKCSPVRETRKI